MDGFRDEAGLFGVSGHRHAASVVYLGLHGLQHRGDGAAGIVASDGEMLRVWCGNGLVQEVFDGPQLDGLKGQVSIGQVMRRATGSMLEPPVQIPTFGRYRGGQVALALAGRLTNGPLLRRELKEAGTLFTTGDDAELVLRLLAGSGQRTFVNRLVDALWKVEGSYTLVACTEDLMVAVRDPRGFRPLVLGRLEDGVAVASEDTALRTAGAQVVREFAPGEMVIVDGGGLRSVSPFPRRPVSACIQEAVTLSNDRSAPFGSPAWSTRRALGERLAAEHPCVDGDVVMGLPELGEPMAVGYAHASGLPFEPALSRVPYTGRRIVEPGLGAGGVGTRLGIGVVQDAVKSRRVVLVVPALLTGESIRRLVSLLRGHGAEQVHLRVGSPSVRFGCAYGVHGPTRDEMAASMHPSDRGLAESLTVDSVGLLSTVGFREVMGSVVPGTCQACLDGELPLALVVEDDQLVLFRSAT